MYRTLQSLGLAVALMCVLAQAIPTAQAGRIGGPLSTVSTVPRGQSVTFDIPFGAGDPAVVTVAGDGMVNVLLSDSDGHTAVGTGSLNRRTVTMSVYRGGVFRVDVRNLSNQDVTFTLTTN